MRVFTGMMVAALAAFGAAAWMSATPAAAADAYCPNPDHQTPAPVPADLVAPVAAVLGIDAATAAPEGTFVRCDGDTLMACTIGANLVCDQADTSKTSTGATSWCKDNPNSDFVPMFATGHATIYAWSCKDGAAVAGDPVAEVDAGGYIAQNWKPVP